MERMNLVSDDDEGSRSGLLVELVKLRMMGSVGAAVGFLNGIIECCGK
jgi:hypothetical protein